MLGSGHPTTVGVWTRSFPMPTRLTSQAVLNKAGQKAWLEGGPTQGKCLWELHGVWGWDQRKNEGVVLRENYFKRDPDTGREVSDAHWPAKWIGLTNPMALTSDRLVHGLLLSPVEQVGRACTERVESG